MYILIPRVYINSLVNHIISPGIYLLPLLGSVYIVIVASAIPSLWRHDIAHIIP